MLVLNTLTMYLTLTEENWRSGWELKNARNDGEVNVRGVSHKTLELDSPVFQERVQILDINIWVLAYRFFRDQIFTGKF